MQGRDHDSLWPDSSPDEGEDVAAAAENDDSEMEQEEEGTSLLPPWEGGNDLPFMPNELWTRILSFLPDMRSLVRLAVVSRQLRACADAAVMEVLQNEVGRDAFPEALAALESAKIGTLDPALFFLTAPTEASGADWTTPPRLVAFADNYMARRAPVPTGLSVPDIRAMLTLHRSVEYLTKKFITFAMNNLYWESQHWLQPQSQAPLIPVSSLEYSRFRRTLYRFQIYCNIWKEPKEIIFSRRAVTSQIETFFRWLTPWELEQIVSLKDFLTAEIIRPLLTHLLKAKPGFEPPSSPTRFWSWFQYQHRLLSHGLNFIYRAATNRRDQFERVVLEQPPETPSPSFLPPTLYLWPNDAFNMVLNGSYDGQSPPPQEGGRPRYEDMTAEQFRAAVRASAVGEHDDPDDGPEVAWRWAYKGFSTDVVCNDVRMVNARRFAYVFWDRRRIREIRFLDREKDGSFWKWRWSGYRLPEYNWGDNAWRAQRTGSDSPPPPLAMVGNNAFHA